MIETFFILSIINILIFFNFTKISKIINLYDMPNKNLKIHKNKTSLIGGSIIMLNIILLFFIDFFLGTSFFDFYLNIDNQLIFLFILCIIFILGFCDDKFNLSPNKKFVFLTLITLIFIILDKNLLVQKISFSFYPHKIFIENYSIFFTVFCFLILINALNFYDGINGQSLIFYFIVFSYLLIISEKFEFYGIILFIITFLLFLNLKKLLFLGDNGIYVLTIILSTALIYEHNVYRNIIFVDEIFMLLFLPGLDLIRFTITRLLKGKNPFYGDRNHIHHLLIKKYSLLTTNLILCFLGITPIIFFNFLKLNFFIAISIFVIIYFLIIIRLKKNESF